MARRTRKPRLLYRAVSKTCEAISVSSPYVANGVRIGTVCKTDKGWMYDAVGPSPTTKYGPMKTKSAAVLAAVKTYRLWIGLAPGRLRGRK